MGDRTFCGKLGPHDPSTHEDTWPSCAQLLNHFGPHRSADGLAWTEEWFPVAATSVPVRANRDPQPTDYSQLSHIALRLMAETQHEGNLRYGYGNWQKGLPISNLLSHALDHILKLQNGCVDENHLGHALWNLEKAAHFIETRPDLIDIIPMRKAMGLDG